MKSARQRSPRKSRLDLNSQTFQLSTAKTYLGRLTDKARKGEPVYIIRGHDRFILQHIPEMEPIPQRPPNYFAHCYSPEEIAFDNDLAKQSVIRPPKDLE
jgi:hypothetical protein